MKTFGVIALIVVAVGGLASLGKHHDNTTSGDTSSASAASSPAASSGSAHITMLRGRSSDNACEENDGDARIYVTITLRNSGDAEGTVNPWATFDYSDGGNSTESYFTNYGHDFTIPAHTVLDATFYHTFNPQQHTMIRCAGYVDLSDSSGYYLPTS
jgi:5-deoxy-D-glucuronate isomerase